MPKDGPVKVLLKSISVWYNSLNRDRYIRWLRRQGVEIGEGSMIRNPRTNIIDLTKPYLITIGRDVHIAQGVRLLTHGYDWVILRELYGQVFGSANRITIGNNVYIGSFATILKGVTIGNNCVIGLGSIVTHDIPDNSVAVGIPAKVICSVEELYEKHQQRGKREAVIIANAIKERYGRDPVPEDFFEHFYLFLERDKRKFGKIPVANQVGAHMDEFMKSKPEFPSFEAFLDYCYAHKYDDPFFERKKMVNRGKNCDRDRKTNEMVL